MPDIEPTVQDDDEYTPLFQRPVDPTPLPTTQVFGLSLLLLAEPIMSLSILPYINEVCFRPAWQCSVVIVKPQLVTQLPIAGGDEKKVGYYAGFIVRCVIFFRRFSE